ncbi:MAG: SIR2 family protein [Candidatus Competibacteraceae bacterium]
MPRFKKLGEIQVARTWQQIIVDQIKAGRAIPVLGNSISNDLILGSHRQLILDFAEGGKYPLVDKDNLAHLTQFMTIMGAMEAMEKQTNGVITPVAVKQTYLDFVKTRLYSLAEAGGAARSLLDEVDAEFDNLDFSELAKHLGYPKFADTPQDDPLLILAGLDLPLYLTTGYHQVMEAALRQAGKQPHTGVCRWNEQLEKDIPDDIFAGGYEPSPEEPLVYHLHGLDKYPASLVLTEDDHLEFLVAISREMGQPTDRIHARIREALTQSSLLLLGYDLESWEFRTLFWGLLRFREVRRKDLKNVSVVHLQIECCQEEQKYLQSYLGKANFEVFWMSAQEYVKKLFKALFGPSYDQSS